MSSSLQKLENLLGVEPIHWSCLTQVVPNKLYSTCCGIDSTVYCARPKEIHKVTCLDCLEKGLKKFTNLSADNQRKVHYRIRKLARLYERL